MPKFDTTYQAFRRDRLHVFRNMDPDDIVCELGIDTDTLMDALWFKIEEYIQQEYDNDNEESSVEDET
jgi:hypothetical protein